MCDYFPRYSTIRFPALCQGYWDNANFRVSLRIYAIAKLLLQLIWYRAWFSWESDMHFIVLHYLGVHWHFEAANKSVTRCTTRQLLVWIQIYICCSDSMTGSAKHHVHLRHNGTTFVYIYKQFIFRLCFSTLWLLVYANVFRWNASRQRRLGHLQLNQLSLFLSHSKSLIGPLGPGEQEVMRAEQSEERVGN